MPPVIGTSSARQAAPMPSTAFANCHMIAGRSGLPKLRQLVAAERPGAGAGDVARRFGHREHRAAVRIEVAVAAVAVDRHRQRAIGAFDAHDARAEAGQVDGVGPHHVVVLAIDPALAGDGRRAEQRQQHRILIARLNAFAGDRLGEGDGFSRAFERVEIELSAPRADTRARSSAADRPALRRSARGSESRRRPRRVP